MASLAASRMSIRPFSVLGVHERRRRKVDQLRRASVGGRGQVCDSSDEHGRRSVVVSIAIDGCHVDEIALAVLSLLSTTAEEEEDPESERGEDDDDRDNDGGDAERKEEMMGEGERQLAVR